MLHWINNCNSVVTTAYILQNTRYYPTRREYHVGSSFNDAQLRKTPCLDSKMARSQFLSDFYNLVSASPSSNRRDLRAQVPFLRRRTNT